MYAQRSTLEPTAQRLDPVPQRRPPQRGGRLESLQRLVGNSAVVTLVQRQAAVTGGGSAGTAAPTPPAPVTLAPSLTIRIVAHASPRWRGADNAKDADQRNLQLSRDRAAAVRAEIDALLRAQLPAAQVQYDVTYEQGEEPADTVVLGAEAVGSQRTLQEARGNRRANDERYRRVEVFVEQINRQENYTGIDLMPSSTSVVKKTTDWSVAVTVNGSASLGGAVSILQLRLTNEETQRSAFATVVAGGGASPGVSASTPLSGGATRFTTDGPVGFADFDGVAVRYTSIGAGLVFIGWEKAMLSFVGMGSGASGIDVGGWNVGAQLKAGGGVVAGPLSFDGSTPSDEYTVPGPTHQWVPYETRGGHGAFQQVTFPTGESQVPGGALIELESFMEQVAGRYAGAQP